MRNFVFIIPTFVLAFGVSLQAILSTGKTVLGLDFFLDLLNSGYWPLYGEIEYFLDKINNKTCLETPFTGPPCLNGIQIISISIILIIYMIISSILLVNLLIAMFR